MGSWDLTVDDINDGHAARQACDRGARGQDARARHHGGRHRLHVSIEGRPALEVTPIKQRGQMMGPVPLWAEVAFAAVEDLHARAPRSSTA